MPYKAVLFDLDGTLLDTLEDIADSANRVLSAMAMPVHPLEAYRYFVGDGMMTLVERIVPEERKDEWTIAQVVDGFRKDYGRKWHVQSRPYEGILPMLTALSDKGMQLAVLSNKPQDFTRLCVERLLSGIEFRPVFGQREGIAKKPDPAGALEVAEILQITQEEFLYLGDTAIDMQTAKNAGMVAVGALWGFRTRDELLASGADHLISSPLELLHLIE